MIQISEITKPQSLSLVGDPIEKPTANHLLILMILQSKTADLASQNQEASAKKKRSAIFAQSLSDELKRRGDFSLDTSSDYNTFIKQVNEQFAAGKLGYSEALMLKQMNKTFSKLNTLKSEMEKKQKDIAELEREISQLGKDRNLYQKELDNYTSKYKKGGFIAPGYNIYLMTKILEYKGKRDTANKDITLKSAEIEKVKKPEFNALKAEAQRIQQGFMGSKETEATKMILSANDELAQFEALLNAAMSSNTFLK